ncbi:MAG: HNH endonuclease [Dehalococcoidales bacterium]|nr:HNH endonuclease [Dehalococcoidales bacterium]
MINSPVLVLNQSYEALNVCRARRAIVLILQGKAEMLEDGLGMVHTARDVFPIPSVIKLACTVTRPRQERKLTRFGVFHRDRHTCQYCGREGRQLTIDHVIPRYQGGQHRWDNVVSACVSCNRRKAGRTPEQARMKLSRRPGPPYGGAFIFIPHRYMSNLGGWQKYLPRSADWS